MMMLIGMRINLICILPVLFPLIGICRVCADMADVLTQISRMRTMTRHRNGTVTRVELSVTQHESVTRHRRIGIGRKIESDSDDDNWIPRPRDWGRRPTKITKDIWRKSVILVEEDTAPFRRMRNSSSTIWDEEIETYTAQRDRTTPSRNTSSFSRSSSSLSAEESSRGRKWNENWDRRDPKQLLNCMAASDEQRKETLDNFLPMVTPTATRNIFLIRHGQYALDSDKRELTKLGREQAAILGKRLAYTEQKSGKKFVKCYISTMPRAKQTAKIILKYLPQSLSSDKENCPRDSILEEGAPCPPEPPSPSGPQKYLTKDNARIEAAFRKYMHRAKPKQTKDSYELMVCHANVIRYFVCRALQFPPEGWRRMSLAHASITWIQIRPSGHVSLRALGDHGHLPPDKVTFS